MQPATKNAPKHPLLTTAVSHLSAAERLVLELRRARKAGGK